MKIKGVLRVLMIIGVYEFSKLLTFELLKMRLAKRIENIEIDTDDADEFIKFINEFYS